MEELRIDPSIAYDVVELPSKGIYYKNKKKSLRIAYLTAADENILLAPNLVANESVVDELLKRKIVDKDFDFNELVDEDKQAILIFLRNTAFGSSYSVELTDPKTKNKFNAEIDLSILKVKDFNLTPDSNGEYPFFLPKTKKNITFKFLTKEQEDEIVKIRNSAKENMVVPAQTKRLEMMIKSVDGDRDMMRIYQFIQNLPIVDSQELRKYVNENKPGIDLTTEVTAPSGEKVTVSIDFGAEFFRPFYGV
jgi:hypothetical protein